MHVCCNVRRTKSQTLQAVIHWNQQIKTHIQDKQAFVQNAASSQAALKEKLEISLQHLCMHTDRKGPKVLGRNAYAAVKKLHQSAVETYPPTLLYPKQHETWHEMIYLLLGFGSPYSTWHHHNQNATSNWAGYSSLCYSSPLCSHCCDCNQIFLVFTVLSEDNWKKRCYFYSGLSFAGKKVLLPPRQAQPCLAIW